MSLQNKQGFLQDRRSKVPISIAWWEAAALIGITAIAVFLRYYRIGEIPPGFNSDEAVGAVGALETLRSGVRLYYEGQGGGGAIAFYIAALAFALFGPSIATIRGTAAFAGVVSVVATYFFVREAFRAENRPSEQTNDCIARASVLALVTAFAVATSSWHFQISRIAFAAIGVPFLQAPAFFFLWRGFNIRRLIHFLISGFLLALVAFIYMSGAFVPLVFLSFFVIEYVITRLRRSPEGMPHSPQQEPLLKVHLRNVLLCAAVAFVCVLPMLYLYTSAPELALNRAQQALFINPLINKGDPWGTLWHSWWGNLAAFGISSSWLEGSSPHNLIMPLPLTLFFLVGLVVSVWRAHRPVYLFTLLSWIVMIIPSVLSPDNIPHQARALGAAIGAYTLVAIGMVTIAKLIYRILRSFIVLFTRDVVTPHLGRPMCIGIIGVTLCGSWLVTMPTLYSDYRYYFTEWPYTNDAQAAFHVYAVELAAEMSKETNPRAVFLLPRDTAAGDVNPNYTVMFLYTGDAGYAWVIDDENTIEQTLSEALAERDIVHVVRWKASKHTGADPKEIIRYYLEKRGRYIGTRRFEFFDLDTYQLEQANTLQWDADLNPTALTFGNVLQVTGYAYGDASGVGPPEQATVPAGDLMWARLRVRLLREVADDLKMSLVVSDRAGHIIGQIDKLLLNNIFHQRTSRWSPGTETNMYFLVPLLSATAPGRYQVELAVYRASDHVRLTVDSPGNQMHTAQLGELMVQRDRVPPSVDTLHLMHRLHRQLTPELALLGFSGPEGDLRPGERATWTLVWHALGRPSQNYHASLWLFDREDTPYPISATMPLASLDFQTSEWQEGEVVRGWLDGQISREASSGEHRLVVRLSDEHGHPVAETELGSLRIASWERLFEVPAIQHHLEANFGNQIELLGYDLVLPDGQQTAPEIVLYWRALSPMEISYTTFVHVLDREGHVLAQVDHVPGDGEFPTTGWLTGEVVADRFTIPLSPDQLGSTHQVEIGIYDLNTMERLPVLDRDGHAQDTRVLLQINPSSPQMDQP